MKIFSKITRPAAAPAPVVDAGAQEGSSATSVAREGISVISEGPEKLIDIVLVHGLNGHPERTWRNTQNNFFWPSSLAQQLPKARVMVFGYDTDIAPSLGSNQMRIRGIALDLLNEIRNVRQDDDQIHRALILVGHSLGGLVIKHALIEAARDPGNDRGEIYRSVKSAMFFGTPNAGSAMDSKTRIQILQKIAKVAFTEVPPKIERALELHSDELLDLADDFRKIEICKTNRLLIYSFYETRDTKFLGERVVDEFSARVAASEEEILPINADHEQMVKFQSESDKTFKNIVVTVKRVLRVAGADNTHESSHNFEYLALMSAKPLGSTNITQTITEFEKSRRSRHFGVPRECKVSNFVGRKAILTQISDIFSLAHSRAQADPTALVLIGMGGIGKTQIALEYCHQAHFSDNHFASVFWVNAHSEEALTTSFVKLAETLGRSSIASFSTEEKVEFVLGSLNAWPHPYLLVYDNYDNPDFDNVLKYTPSYGSGALLFTSRLRSAASLLQNAIQVDVMTEEEALDLLISRSGLRGSASRDTDRIHGSKVVQILDGLPLALDQAAAYIRASNGNVTLENFVDCFEQRKKEILDHTPPVWLYRNTADENEKRRYLSVFTTWELSLRLLGSNAEDREKKTRFLTLAAFLGGHRVSKVLFKTYIARQANSYVSAIENGWSDIFRGSTRFDDNRFRDVIVELNDLSLIRGFTETNSGGLHFTVHSLVQEWARSRLELEKQKVLSREATSIMTHLFQEFQSKLSLNPDISKLVTDENPRLSAAGKDAELLATEMIVEIAAHVLACLKHADEIGPKLDGSGIAEQYFASFMETCDIDQAAQLWERLLEHAWLHYGDDSPRTFELLRYVCGLRAMQKPNPDRKKWMEELLQRLHVVEIHDDPNTLLLLCNLSCLYAEIGPLETYKETIAKLTNALQGVTLQSNQIFLYVALKTLENLIMLAQLQAAEALLDRVLEALEFYSLEERAWIFSEWVMEPLYKLFMIQEKFKDAEEAVEEDLQRQILRWGHDHPVVISVRAESLAKCYAAQGRWHDAANAVEPYFHYLRRAIGICHPLTQRKGLHLAECYIRAHPDDMDEADEVVADILTSQRKTHGPMCYRTLQLEREAANMYSMCGKYRTAFMMYKSAYETHREWLGPEDEVVISLEGLYAISLTKVPDRSESEIADVSGMLAPQIAVLEAQYGLNGTLTMCVRQVLLDFSYGVQKYEHALDLAQIQLAIREELDPSSYSSWQSRGYLIACYRRLGRHDEALELLSKGVEWMRAREGDNSDTTISALETLADTCSAAGKYEKAEELYQKILRHRIKKFGSHHIQTMLMRKSLALNRSNAGLFPGAVEEFKTILTWARMRYGEEDEKTIELIILIAHSTFKQKTPAKLLEAESYYTMVVKWFTKHKQGKIELVLVANSWMVECLIAASKHSEAILYEEKRLNILETKQNFGPNAELTINTAFNLAGLYLVVSDFAKARPLCERVLAWQKGVHGPNNIKTLAAMFGVGLAYIGLEQYAEAKLYLLQIVESRAIMFGGDGMTRDLLPYLSGVARALENWAEAEGYQLRILELSQKANASAEILMEGRYHVAVMRLRQGKALEAELDLAQALAWRMQHLGLHHPDTMNNCYWYAESQYQLQDYKMAAEHFGFILDYKGEGTPVPEERFQQARERVEACRSKIAAVEGMATLKLSDGQSATTQ